MPHSQWLEGQVFGVLGFESADAVLMCQPDSGVVLAG